MKNETLYEWAVETLEKPHTHDDGFVSIDIADHYHCETLEEAVQYIESDDSENRFCVTLVKSVGNKEDGVLNRDWFYVGDAGIPSGCPAKFAKELKAKNRLERLKACHCFMSNEEYCEITNPIAPYGAQENSMSIKEELKAAKVDLFRTPKTFSEIEDWVDMHSADEKAHLYTAAMMAWNYALDYAAEKIEAKEGVE